MKNILTARIFLQNPRDEVLVLRRSHRDNYRPGEYDLPGDGVEADERPDLALIREVREETGIVLTREAMSLVYASAGVNQVSGDNVVRLFYTGDTQADEVVLSHEHHSYEWVGADKASELITHPSHAEALRYIRDNNIGPRLAS